MADNSLSKFHSLDNLHLIISGRHNIEKAPRICVICTASYDLGILHGVWVNMAQDIECIYGKINDMLTKSPARHAVEWSILAFEGFESILLDKYEDIEQIRQKAIFLVTYGKWSVKVLEYFDNDISLAEEAMVNHYQGKFSDELDFAMNLFNEKCGVVLPEHARPYIDYESFKNGIFSNDYFSIKADSETFIFSTMRE